MTESLLLFPELDFQENNYLIDHQVEELLLKPNPNKYVLFPLTSPEIYEMKNKQIELFWRSNEINPSSDLDDWKNKLNANERQFICYVLAFFAASDGLVSANLADCFSSDVQLPEARMFYAGQNHMEGVHSEVYSTLIVTYVENLEERHKLLSGIQHFVCIAEKAAWTEKFITHKSHISFAARLVAFACVEGIFFSSSFASIYWLKKRGLMGQLTFSNEFIARDEGMHTKFACLLYSTLRNKLHQKTLHGIIKSAVQLEKRFVNDSLECGLIGMNSTLMCQYVEFVADRLCLQLGGAKIYNVENPFPWMELISLPIKTNFFEKKVSEYSKVSSCETNIVDITEDEDCF